MRAKATTGAGGAQEKRGGTSGEASRSEGDECLVPGRCGTDGSAISASDAIKLSLDERSLEILEGCVQLMGKQEVRQLLILSPLLLEGLTTSRVKKTPYFIID